MKPWKQGIIYISKSIKRCDKCRKPIGLTFVCSYCHRTFCEDCRLPETHICKNFDSTKAIPLYKKL